jgi:hypothetical protein
MEQRHGPWQTKWKNANDMRKKNFEKKYMAQRTKMDTGELESKYKSQYIVSEIKVRRLEWVDI